ncbi:MAG: hypothetical protein WDW38_006472 [Sanguina aurantia]
MRSRHASARPARCAARSARAATRRSRQLAGSGPPAGARYRPAAACQMAGIGKLDRPAWPADFQRAPASRWLDDHRHQRHRADAEQGDGNKDKLDAQDHGLTSRHLQGHRGADALGAVAVARGYQVDYILRDNGIEERGIPGVRVVSVEGLIMETDAYGRFHLDGIDGGEWARGRNFILKVDPSTLPPGSVFTTENPRVAGMVTPSSSVTEMVSTMGSGLLVAVSGSARSVVTRRPGAARAVRNQLDQRFA